MHDIVAAGLIGVAAGLAIAMPLGAVAVLLLRTGLTAGWRTAAAGALGVASVDLAYATVAVLAGSVVAAALAGHEQAVRVVGALVLAAIALRGMWRTWRTVRGSGDAAGATGEVAVPVAGPAATWARFVALTALNPATVVYFAVAAAAFATRWQGAGERVAFVLGVGLASAAWQLALAGVGAAAGARAGARTRLVLGVVGDAAVLALAVVLVVG